MEEEAASKQASATQTNSNIAERSSVQNDGLNVVGVNGDCSTRLSQEDIAALRAHGMTVDDDNDALPENVPYGKNTKATAAVGAEGPNGAASLVWERPAVDPRKAQGLTNTSARFTKASWETIAAMNDLQIWMLCYPVKYFTEVVIPATNPHLKMGDTDLQELICFFGCEKMMACFEGISDRRMWFSKEPINMYAGAPFRLNEYMTGNRFEDIMQALRYTTCDVPDYEDKFYEVREMEDCFNDPYECEYVSSYLTCLDESMAIWLNQYCPGWMCVPRKPHPFGNKRHTLADTYPNVIFRSELVEGKDRPEVLGKREFAEKGETVGTMLRLSKPLWNSGKIVEIDSSFCVARGIVEMKKRGVYGDGLVKKRRYWYWPKHVPGAAIDTHFEDREVGETESLKVEVEGETMWVHCMQDAGYVTKIISCHGTLTEVAHPTYRSYKGDEGQKTSKTLNYTDPSSRYYHARHAVDDNNNQWHDPISFEESWATKWWPHRQMAWHMAVAEVNACNVKARARKVPAEPQLVYRRSLAKLMLTNNLDNNGRERSTYSPRPKRGVVHVAEVHKLETKPKFAGMWRNGECTKVAKMYQQNKCECGFCAEPIVSAIWHCIHAGNVIPCIFYRSR